jgi:hypothetical protein
MTDRFLNGQINHKNEFELQIHLFLFETLFLISFI